MISKNMYKVLKNIPHAPATTNYKKLNKMNIINNCLLATVLDEAENYHYISFNVDLKIRNGNEVKYYDFSLIEAGQVAIEEYKSQKSSSKKATLAIIISALSFIASAVAIVLSICDVQ